MRSPASLLPGRRRPGRTASPGCGRNWPAMRSWSRRRTMPRSRTSPPRSPARAASPTNGAMPPRKSTTSPRPPGSHGRGRLGADGGRPRQLRRTGAHSSPTSGSAESARANVPAPACSTSSKATPQVPDWHSAVSDFRRSLAEVQSLSAERRAVSAHVNNLAAASRAHVKSPPLPSGRHVAATERGASAAAPRWPPRLTPPTAARRKPTPPPARTRTPAPGSSPPVPVSAGGTKGGKSTREEVRQAAAEAVTARESLAALDREIAAARRAERQASDALGQGERRRPERGARHQECPDALGRPGAGRPRVRERPSGRS